jgi:hypothetical protein
MNDTRSDAGAAGQSLQQELDRVGKRFRRLLLWTGLALCWVALAVAGLAALSWARGSGRAIPGVLLVALVALPVVFLPLLLRWLRRVRDPNWIAHRVERKFPDLDARLLAALEQRPDESSGKLGFLQLDVIAQAVAHARQHGWEQVVSRRKLRAAKWGQWAALATFAIVIGSLALDLQKRPSQGGFWLGGIARRYHIKVEPEDTSLERGTGLLVLARFDDEVPTDVTLTYRDAEGRSQQLQMSKSLDDPVFAGRVPAVNADISYVVKYADKETRPYKVTVFDYPELKQADAKLKFPEYTKLAEKLVEDTRAVTAVEGTRATLTFRLNKPVKDAQLVPATARGGKDPTTKPSPVPLVVDPNDPSVYTVALDMRQSQRFALDLIDADGRKAKQPAELTLNVTPNQPPELKLAWPGKDIDVSPIQEMAVKAQVWDDFGVNRVGLSYAMAGQEPKDVVLAESVGGKEKRDVATLLSLEKLSAEPDQLLTYHLWVEDLGPDGGVRRTVGDMFFAEVRPFEMIYRQGQQPSAEQQQQQQQQQQGGNAQQAEELAELQKQIINATWKVMRRETKAQATPEMVGDGKLLHESQQSARKQAAALAQRLEDARSKQHLAAVLKSMDEAVKQLNLVRNSSIPALAPALAAEQAAYQNLLKLRAREHEVVRSQRQQRGGQQSASSASSRRQQQLNQLELQQEQNRYETQRRAQQQQQNPDDPAAREQRQVLNRLRELAQRQEDLNKQMKDLQAALQKALEEQQREELKRQLARLRDQQQEMLRDTDELRDRMDQPQNQQRMADSREQLENTRENVRRASEALENGMVPEASASGARAAEDLNKLRDDFRKGTAQQLAEDMNKMRDEARQLDQRQQELANELQRLDQSEQRKLRDSGERKQVAEGLGQQRERLGGLLKDMQRTTEESEQSEPLVSRQLHDAAREAARSNTDQSLESTRQMLDRGFVNEARQAEADASKGLTKLREGVEKAAESVLGDETEGLRRASDELDQLARELDQELSRNGQAMGGATSWPSRDGRSQLAQNGPTTRGVARANEPREGDGSGDPQEQQKQQQQQREQQARAGGRGEQQDGPTTRSVARAGQRGERQQSGEQQGQGEQQQAQADGQQPQPGSQQEGESQQGESQQGESQQGQSQEGQQASAGGQQQRQQGGQQPGQGQGQQQDQQANAQSPQQQGQQQGQGQGRGERQQGQQQAQAGGPGGLRGGDPQDGERQANAQDQQGQERQQREGGEGDLRRLAADPQERTGAETGGSGPMAGGEQFREWSDRLRDVEEMVGDPRLRAEAARIRERARSLRAEANRHSKEPNWELVREFVGRPLVELRDAVADELMRKQTAEAMVPIDREPVPPQYVERVKEYYERLGSGR